MVADGKAHVSEGRTPVVYEWHGMVWTIDTYVMSNEHLAFPLVLGLDFLRQTGVQLNVAAMSSRSKGRFESTLFYSNHSGSSSA